MTKASGDDRYAAMLDCGAKLVSKHGAQNVTRRMVAKACKCSEGLVAHYMGPTADAQKLYASQARKLKLTLPTKAEAEAIGAKLRAHGPRKAPVKRTSRVRSEKEVKAIKKAVAAKKSAAAAKKSPVATKRDAAKAVAGKAGAAKKSAVSSTPAKPASAARATAARKPKSPPPLPPLPIADALPPLPPVEAAGLPPLPMTLN